MDNRPFYSIERAKLVNGEWYFYDTIRYYDKSYAEVEAIFESLECYPDERVDLEYCNTQTGQACIIAEKGLKG